VRYVSLVIMFISMVLWSCGREMISQLNIIGPDSVPQVLSDLQITATVKVIAEEEISEKKFEKNLCGGVYIEKGVILTAYHCVSSKNNRNVKVFFDLPIAWKNYKKTVFDIEKIYQVSNSDLAVLIFNEGLTDFEITKSDFPKPASVVMTYPDKPLDVWAEGFGGIKHVYDDNEHFRQASLTLYPKQYIEHLGSNEAFRNTITSPLPWPYRLNSLLKNHYFSRLSHHLHMFIHEKGRKDLGMTVPRLSQHRNTAQKQDSIITSTATDAVGEDYITSSMICNGDSGAPLYTVVGGHIQVVGIVTDTLIVPSSIVIKNGEIKQLNILERIVFLNKLFICSNLSIAQILPGFASEIRYIIDDHFQDAKR